MTATTWTWNGSIGLSSLAANWTLTSGPGNDGGVPAPGDVVIIPSGTVTDALEEISGQGEITIEAGATLSVIALGDSISLGQTAGTSATLTVSGTAARVNAASLTSGIVLGTAGKGALLVQNGGSVLATAVVLGGSLAGPGGGAGTLALTGSGDVEVLGGLALWDGSTISVDASSGLDLGTSGSLAPGVLLLEGGQELTGSGTIAAAVTNDGTIIATNNGLATLSTGGSLEIAGGLSGTGALTIAPGATLQLDGSLAATQAIDFMRGTPGALIIQSQTGTITNSINGFGVGDMIDLPEAITFNSFSIQNGATLGLTVTAQNAGGTVGVYDFNNITLASGSPVTFAVTGDPFAPGLFIMPTHFFTWFGGGTTTNYDDPTNWNFGQTLPGAHDFADFANGIGGTVTGTGAAGQLEFNATGTWTLGAGASLAATIGLQVGLSGGGKGAAGDLLLDGGTIVSNGTIGVGENAGNIATVTVSGGGNLLGSLAAEDRAGMTIAGAAVSGTLAAAAAYVTVTGTDSLLDVGLNALDIAADGGTGSLTVSQGGSAHAATANSTIGDALVIGARGSGAVTVTDPGSQFTATGVVSVAQSQTGTLSVVNRGSFLAAADPMGQSGLMIGVGSLAVGGSGAATVTTGGVLDSTGYVDVGMRGVSGQLAAINGGTVEVGTTLTVGDGGTIGSGATETGDGSLTIGAGATVELTGTAQSGSYGVYLANSDIGTATTENAAASVTGAGALLNTSGQGIAIGQYGNADLTVSLGGSVVAGTPNSGLVSALALGREGSGTVTVTGTGSHLAANGEAFIGRAGDGSLTVANLGSVTIGLDSQNAGGLDIGGDGTAASGALYTGGTGAAVVSTGGDLFSQSNIDVGEDGSAGSLAVTTGGTAEAGGRLLIGVATTVTPGATLIMATGTTAVTASTVESGNGVVSIGPGGLLAVDGGGISSAGTAALVIGAGDGSTGALDVAGAGAAVHDGGNGLDVGASGEGAMLVSQGGTVLATTQFGSDPAIAIGVDAGALGSVTVTDPGSSLQASGQIDVGASGPGSLTIENQGTVQSGGSTQDPSQGIDVAQDNGAIGSIVVTGTQSLLNNTGQFIVGDSGIGSMAILLGGTVNTGPGTVSGLAGMVIANTDNSVGSEVDVTGAGSQLNVAGFLDVGAVGFGVLQIAGGATVTAASLDAGVTSTAGANISLAGAGTDLAVSGTATISDDGVSVFSVLSGATFSAASLTIGNQGDSSGAVVVSGNGSAINLTGSLSIGTANGTGDLTVGPGAAIQASAVFENGQVVLEGGLLDPTVQLINQGQTAGGFGTIAAGDIVDEGAIQAGGNKSSQKLLIVQGTVLGGGTLTVNGTLPGSVPAGIMQINAGGTLELSGAVLNAASTTFTDNLTPTGTYTVNNSVIDVNFVDSAGVLLLDDIAGFGGTITTYQAGDSFVITGGTLSGLGVSNGDTLTVSDAGSHAGAGNIDRIIFGSAVSAAGFKIVNSNTIQAQAPCFAAGTRIETERGLVAVENLSVGDTVRTLLGDPGEIVWAGSRAVNCRAHPRPETVWPIRVARGAFGENVPARDLFVSPDHSVYAEGVLIPAKYLLNGSTIRQVRVPRVVYHHIELFRHDVVLAEGLPTETYLDAGDRSKFDGGTVTDLHPEFTARAWEMLGCAQLVTNGPKLAAVRRRVDAAAGVWWRQSRGTKA